MCQDSTSDDQTVSFRGDSRPPPEHIGRYVVQRELGHGSYGKVYLADDQELQRRVAIKVPRADRVDPGETVERFLEEAQTVAQLRHASIVAVYDVGRSEDGWPFVVMEYVEGITLKERLASGRPSPAQAAEWIAEVADAIGYAHRQGFIHRDLKPANVLLDAAGKPHVLDLGLALHESRQHQRAGEFSGTLAYMAPEQVRREAHRLDGRADIWALGIMLYEMLTGRRPFQGENAAQIEDEILHREPKPPRQIDETVPEQLERICLKCLAKDVTQRYGAAADVARDLRGRDVSVASSGWQASRTPAPGRSARRTWGLAAAVVGAMAAALIIFSVRPGRGPGEPKHFLR